MSGYISFVAVKCEYDVGAACSLEGTPIVMKPAA